MFGSRWPLFGPPWPSPGLPSLQFDSLDPQIFRDLQKSVLGLFRPYIGLVWPRDHHRKIRLEILHIWASAAYQMELVVQFYGHVNPFHPTVAVKTELYNFTANNWCTHICMYIYIYLSLSPYMYIYLTDTLLPNCLNMNLSWIVSKRS